MNQRLFKKIKDRIAVIAVVGIGYVGLNLAVELAKAGYKTIGLDMDMNKVEMVNRGQSYIEGIEEEELCTVIVQQKLSASMDFSCLKEVDCVLICVPTPLDQNLQPDISSIKESVKQINQYLHKGMLIVLESTTYPGTTEEVVKPLLEQTELVCEQDFYLAFSPERVDPGNKIFNIKNTSKLVSGIGKDSTELAELLYKELLDAKVLVVSNPAVAEMVKVFENTFRYINIAFVNEMAVLCNSMGIDIWEVIAAAESKPYGFMPFYPGPGIGGHCIPIDPLYLDWKFKEKGFTNKFIQAAREIDGYMPKYVVERSAKILRKFDRTIEKSNILLLGVAYKQNINDVRESPVLHIIKLLEADGATVKYNDPFISKFRLDGREYTSIELTEDNLCKSDLVIISTPHSIYDLKYIQKNSKYIFDIRNAINGISYSNVERL